MFGVAGSLIDGTGKRSFAQGTFVHSGSPAAQNISTGLSTIDWAGVYLGGSSSIAIIDTGVSQAVSGDFAGISVTGGTITITTASPNTYKWFAVSTT